MGQREGNDLTAPASEQYGVRESEMAGGERSALFTYLSVKTP